MHKNINKNTVYNMYKYINPNTDIIQVQCHNKSFFGNI